MIDYFGSLTELSFGLSLWCFLLVMLIIVVTWNTNYKFSVSKPISTLTGWRTTFLFLAFLLLSLTYWIDTDTFGYMNLARICDVDFKYDENLKMEKGHQFFCSIVNGDWLGFRFLCWGSALILFVLTAKRLNINIQHALFCLFILWYHVFCYGRVTLAASLYIFGLSFLIKPLKSSVLSYLFGIGIILCSIYFHRSAILLIGITPSIFMFSVKKRVSWFYIISLFIFILAVIYINAGLLYQSQDLDSGTMTKLQMYSERELYSASFLGQIRSTLYYLVKYSVVAVITYVIIKNRKHEMQGFAKMLYALTITMVAVAVGFYFSGDSQFTLFYRTLNFTMVPSSLLLAYFHQYGYINQKLFHCIIGFGAFMSFFRVFYAVYYA